MNKLKHIILACSLATALTAIAQGNGYELYRDMNAPMHERIMDLLKRMTVEEKVSMMTHNAPAIPRLGIDKFYHGNEALQASCGRASSPCSPTPSAWRQHGTPPCCNA